jgi:hypothetical protein
MDEKYICQKCDSELTIQKGKYTVLGYCPKCIEEQHIPNPNRSCCLAPGIEPVKIPMNGGGFQIRKHCNNCGDSFGWALKASDFDLSKLQIRDDNKQIEYREAVRKEVEAFQIFFKEYRRQNYSVENKFPGYKDYMQSEIWNRKRKLVLERDKYVCQSCLSAKAIQVHHLKYDHVFNEPLFDLISVCIRCHEIITTMDRNLRVEKKSYPSGDLDLINS